MDFASVSCLLDRKEMIFFAIRIINIMIKNLHYTLTSNEIFTDSPGVTG